MIIMIATIRTVITRVGCNFLAKIFTKAAMYSKEIIIMKVQQHRHINIALMCIGKLNG